MTASWWSPPSIRFITLSYPLQNGGFHYSPRLHNIIYSIMLSLGTSSWIPSSSSPSGETMFTSGMGRLSLSSSGEDFSRSLGPPRAIMTAPMGAVMMIDNTARVRTCKRTYLEFTWYFKLYFSRMAWVRIGSMAIRHRKKVTVGRLMSSCVWQDCERLFSMFLPRWEVMCNWMTIHCTGTDHPMNFFVCLPAYKTVALKGPAVFMLQVLLECALLMNGTSTYVTRTPCEACPNLVSAP